MPRYMLVVKAEDGKTFAKFYEEHQEAESARMNCTVSLGWYAEVYERMDTDFGREYVLIYA